VTSDVSATTINQLNKIGIKTILLNNKYIADSVFLEVKKNKSAHYVTAFTKLLLLSDEVASYFDKIVYLDTDLQIFKNIDDLFDLPHMSAVRDRAPAAVDKETRYILGCSRFCSGLFV
jgi:alpha-N-acetylglucosamine transferase